METDFLLELDHWVLAVLHDKLVHDPSEPTASAITATDFAALLLDYLLLRLAEDPDSCWSACGLDQVSDEQIMAKTTFSEELLAASFIGAVAELGHWGGTEGVAFMYHHGVPADDAQAVANAVDVVVEKLGTRGQAIILRLADHHRASAAIAQ